MEQRENIKKIFEQNDGFMRTAQLAEFGIYYKKLQQLMEEGIIEQVKRGCYQYVDGDAFSDLAIITKLFPDGILYLNSALEQYDYLERTPSAWHIAVDAKSSRTRFYIDYPIVKPHFIRTERLNMGITDIEIDSIRVRIYDRDKTICDCLQHRNKMDAEVFNYAIRCYLKDNEKNLARLAQYAKLLHVEKKVREILGIWL